MATYTPLHNTPIQYMDNSGDPLVNGTLEFYDAGTTTGQDLFSDDEGTPIGISITLNSWGMPESGGNTIFLFRDQSKALKVVGKNAAGVTIWTADDIPAVASFDSASSDKLATIETGADVTDATNVSAAGALMKDGSTSMSGDLAFDGGTFVKWSTVTGIVASTTQAQGETPLTAGLNHIATVANNNDAATLPDALAGRQVIVLNNGANTLQLFPASGDSINGTTIDSSTTVSPGDNIILEAYDATNWEIIFQATAAVNYGAMYHESNATAYTINAQSDKHCFHSSSFSDGGTIGWTFDPGGSGTSVAIASIADGADSGVDIEVTTTGNHGLAVGDIISQTNLTSAVYTGIFEVKAIISTTQYEVEAVYTATDTGTMDKAATLTCDSGAGGLYHVDWQMSATPATLNETFEFQLFLEDAYVPGANVRNKFGAVGDYYSVSGGSPIFNILEGQKLSFMLANNDTAGNITVRNMMIKITRA